MNISDLRQFLIDSNQAGYAGGEEKKWIKEADHSTTIPYEKGDWKLHDNFFGGEPYGGREVAFYQNKPVWMMTYYGWVEPGVATDPVYEILRGALMRMPKEYPFRGPKKFVQGDYEYTNSWGGTLKRFSGNEVITHNHTTIYEAYYRGGLVDQRTGL